jgi:dTDP-glucose pyrophosphorylase
MKFIEINALKNATLGHEDKLENAIHSLNNTALKIIFVVDIFGNLFGVITDGDIRRAILSGKKLDTPLSAIANKSPVIIKKNEKLESSDIEQLMHLNNIMHLPLVENNKILGLYTFYNINNIFNAKTKFVIMAGGTGSRLRPETLNCPKPLLRVGNKPILEHILLKAKSEGFKDFLISVNYLSSMIEDYFGSGKKWEVDIKYLYEPTPLGTAGALVLNLDLLSNGNFLVTNGDVLVDLDYGNIVDFHQKHDAIATMAIRAYELQNPYGVVHTNGSLITGLEEKPVIQSHINAGIYVLNPAALLNLTPGQFYDMPMLFESLLVSKQKTVAFPLHESWLDVGRRQDLIAARSNPKFN